MTTEELLRQNELAENLLEKLERVKALWADLPNEDEMEAVNKAAAEIAGSLQEAKETWNSHEFPGIEGGDDTLDVYNKVTAEIASNLKEAAEAKL